MPEINVIKNLSELNLPSVKRPDIARNVTVDLQYDSNAYDANYRPDYNQEYNRAANQSWYDAAGSGLLSRTISLIPKVVGGLGSVVSIPEAIAKQEFSPLWDNAITKWAGEADDKLRDVLPVYSSDEYEESGWLGKFGTEKFWVSDLADGLAYAASAFAPGSVIGKGTTALSGIGKGLTIGKTLGALDESLVFATKTFGKLEGGAAVRGLADAGLQSIDNALQYGIATPTAKAILGTRDLVKTTANYLKALAPNAQQTNLALSTAYNTVAEAAAEAYGTRKDVYETLIAKGIDEATATQKAGEAAARTFKANAAALLVPNFIENTFFHGAWGSMQKKLKNEVWENADAVRNATVKSDMWGKVGTGFASEGLWEENIQTSIQQYEKNLAKGRLSDEDNYFDEVIGNMGSNALGFLKSFNPFSELSKADIEGGTAIALGGLIGSGMGAYGASLEKKQKKEFKDDELKRYDQLFGGELSQNAQLIFRENVNSIYKQDPNKKNSITLGNNNVELSEIVLDDAGNPVIDSEKVKNLTINQMRDKRFWDAATVAAFHNDPVMAEMNKHMAMSSFVYSLMDKGYSQSEIGKYLDSFDDKVSEDSKAIGVDSIVRENIALGKSLAAKFENIENNNSSKAKELADGGFDTWVKKNLFYIESKREALKNIQLRATSEEAKNSINKSLEDLDGFENELTRNRKKVYEVYKDLNMSRDQILVELGDLKRKKDKTPEDVLRIRELSYKRAEDVFTNGENLDNTEARKAVGYIGRKGELETAIGRNTIAINGIKDALKDKVPASYLMDLYGALPYSNDETDELKKTLDEGVSADAAHYQGMLQRSDILRTVATSLSDYIEDEDPSEIANVVADILANNGVDPTATEQVMNDLGLKNALLTSKEFGNISLNLNNIVASTTTEDQKSQIALSNINRFLDGEFDDKIKENNTVVKDYLKAGDKTKFVKDLFFKEQIEKPTVEYIGKFNEELIEDEFEYNQLHDALLAAKAHFESIGDDATLAKINKWLDIMEGKIYPALIKNINQRSEKHRAVNNAITTHMVKLAFKTNEKLFTEVLGDEKMKALKEELSEGADGVLPFDGILAIISEFRDKATEDQKNRLLEFRSKEFAPMFASFNLPPKRVKELNTYSVTNPIYTINQIISAHYGENPPDYIVKFLNDYDFSYLAKAAVSDEFAQTVKTYYEEVIGLSLVNKLMSSDLDYGRFVDLKSKLTQAPSLQQNIVLTQGMLFLTSKTGSDQLENYLLSKGIGGSGKTFLLANSLYQMYKELNPNAKVYAFSKSKLTSENINNSLFGDKTKGSFEEFMAMDISAIDYFVIDEVYTFTAAELNAVTAKIGGGKKVIALGDPSQLKAEKVSKLDTSLKAFNTIPLTTSYRTNVSFISSFISKFQLNPKEVSSPTATASSSIEDMDTTSNAFGVIGASNNEFDTLLRKPTTRSRVILVTSQEDKAKYAGYNVPVLTVAESQGYQWDEVFTTFNELDLPSEPFERNKVFYTAYSRTKSLLVTNDASVINSAPEANMDATIRNSEEELVKTKDYFNSTINSANAIQAILSGVVVISPAALKEDTASVEDIEVNSSPDIEIAGAFATLDEDFDTKEPLPDLKYLAFPTNEPLAKGDTPPTGMAYIVPVHNDAGEKYFRVVMKGSTNKYYSVGLLSKEEADSIDKVDKPSFHDNNFKGYALDIGDVEGASVAKIFIRATNKLSISYENEFTLAQESYPNGATSLIEDVLIKFYNSYYGTHPNGLDYIQNLDSTKRWVHRNVDGTFKVNWDAISPEDVSVRIFSRNGEGTKPGPEFANMSIQYGLPYLVLKNLTQVDKNGEVVTSRTRPFIIPLNSSAVTANEVGELIKFTNAAEALQEELGVELGSEEFGDAVRDASKNYEVDPTVKLSDNTFGIKKVTSENISPAMDQVIRGVFAGTKRLVTFKTEEDAQEFLDNYDKVEGTDYYKVEGEIIVSITENKNGKFILNASRDSTDREKDTVPFRKMALREGMGKAQLELNNLAKANSRANGQQLRRNELKWDPVDRKNKKQVGVYRAASLLTNYDVDDDGNSSVKAFTDYDRLYADPTVQRLLGDTTYKTLTDLITGLQKALQAKDNEDAATARSLAKAIIDFYTSAETTLPFLQAITKPVEETGFNIELNMPISMSEANSTNIPKDHKEFSRKLSSNFVKVNPTWIAYETEELEKPEEEDEVSGLKSKFEKLNVSGPHQRIKDLVVKALPENSKYYYMPKGIYAEGELRTDVIATRADTQGAISIFAAYPFEVVTNQILLHEGLHAITIEALRKGQKDRISKKNTPEAALYQKIAALKKRFDGAVKGKKDADGNKYKLADVYESTISKTTIFEFVASLSKPEFRKLAQEIPVLPKSKDSILKRLLESILEYFKDLLGMDANIYDATLAVLEDFYSAPTSFPEPLPTKVITESVKDLKANFLKRANAQLDNADEYEFDEVISDLQTSYPHLTNFPTFGETSNVKFNSHFDTLSEEQQLMILSGNDSSHFAYFNQNTEQVYTHLGAIYTTKSMGLYIDDILANELARINENNENPVKLTREQVNLIKSVIFLDASNPKLKLLNNILSALANDANALYDILFTNVFNNKDKSEFRILTSSKTNKEAFDKMLEDARFNGLFEALGLLGIPEFKLATQKVENRSAARYLAAKNFVLGIVAANMSKKDEIMKVRGELLSSIRSSLDPKNASSFLLPNGLTRSQTAKKIKELYAEYRTADATRKLELIYNEIPALEDDLAGIDSLTSLNARTGDSMFTDIVKDIYPNTNFDEEAIHNIDLELAELGEEEFFSPDADLKESSGILEYLKLYNKSYENTLSESMKDFLSFIRVGDRFISSGLAYIKSMQLAISLDWSQTVVSGSNSVINQLSKLIREGGLSNLDKSIIENLMNTIHLATDTTFLSDGVTLPPNLHITAVNSIAGINSYYAYESPSLLTADQIAEIPNSGKLQRSGALYLYLKNKQPNLTIQQFNKMLQKADAINVLRGIHNTMASMKDTDLFISTRTSSFGTTLRMVKSRASDISVTTKEYISNALYERFSDGSLKELSKLYNKHKVTVSGETKTVAEALNGQVPFKKQAIRYFYELLGFPTRNLTIKDEEVNELVEKIRGLLKQATEYEKTFEISEDGVTRVASFPDWLENVDGYLSEINKVISRSDEFIRNPSVRDINGNKFYKYHESSFLYDTINNLIDVDSSLSNAATGKSKFRRIPDHLRTSIHKHNIFGQSSIQNKVYAVGEYAGAKNVDNNSVTEYLRENKFFFFQRKFITGFVDGLRQYGKSYHQFTYIPSDSPKHPVVRIGVLSMEKSLGALAEMFQALKLKKSMLKDSIIDIEKYENSVRNDLFANFSVGEKVSTEFEDWTTIDNSILAQRAFDYLVQEASSYLSANVKELTPTFDKKMMHTLLSSEHLFNEAYADKIAKIKEEFISDSEVKNFTSRDKQRIELIEPLFTLFYLNNAINSYNLNQLFLGDYSAFPSTDMIIKRFAGAKAPGIKGLVDPIIGMKETYKLGILADTKVELASTREKFEDLFFNGPVPEAEKEEFENFMTFFGEDFESTDAQGFMTPARLADLSRGFEKSWQLGNVHKPVYFGVDAHMFSPRDEENPVVHSTSIARYIKNSTVVITDKLAAKFKYLGRIREMMENQGLDEVVFRSAVKVGMPIQYQDGVKLTYPTMSDIQTENFTIPSLTLSNHNYRLQFNATTDVEKSVTIYSQLQYFLNVYGDSLQNPNYDNTQEAARQVYSLVGELIRDGKEQFFKDLETRGLGKYLISNLSGSGAERALDLLYNGINHNHPLIEKKGVIAVASGLEKATTKIKFKGGKLVLQTAEGVSWDTEVTTTNNTDPDTLSYKYEEIDGRKMLVAEVVMPIELLTPEQRVALKQGKTIYAMPDGMAFRIPSTELHSAIAFRIKDTYPGSKTNVIIAPKELVPIHGSDFDVDSLFVIMRETVSSQDSTFINGQELSTMINGLGTIFNELHTLEQSLDSQEDILALQELKRDLKKLFQLSMDVTTAADSLDIERDYAAELSRHNPPNETKFKREWMKRNHVSLDSTGAMLASSLYGLTKLTDKITAFGEANPNFKPYVKNLLKISTEISSIDMTIQNEVDTPVGYEVKNNKYVFDRNYINLIKANLEYLENLRTTIQPELKPAFDNVIKSSIKVMKSLKSKYIKNFVTETMLDVITDENNKYRMTTPIAFHSLKEVIDQEFYKSFQVTKKLDLSNLEDEFTAFEMLTAGVVLTGAFANAAKSFGYLSTAGAEKELNSLYLHRGKLVEELNLTTDSDKKTMLTSRIDNLTRAIDKYYKSFEFKEYRSPVLNYDTRYRFNINGEEVLFDRIATKDAAGKYSVTQVFDTLTNAAIDNLKLGYLYRAGINQNTGNAVVGLVSTGLPLEAIIALLYQDVFKPLTKSKVKNAETFVKDLLKEHPKNNRVLSLEDLKNNLREPNAEITAAAVHLFAKGFKIGGDMRTLSTFLNIIRETEVFVQDLFKVPENLQSKIGTYQDGVLKSRQDYSFIIPNMFRSAPHIKEAFEVNTDLISYIKDNWLLHSDTLIELSKMVHNNVKLTDAEETGEELVKIRRAFSNYLLASDPMIKDRLESVKPKSVKLNDGVNYVLSKQRTFNDQVADKIQRLQNWDRSNSVGNRNEFLNNITIEYNDQKLRVIKFRAGIGLKPEDAAQIALGFKELNRFKISDDGTVSKALIYDNTSISDIQRDLATYALLNLGLDNISSSYAAYINPSLFEDVVNRYVAHLKVYSKAVPVNMVSHFTLHNALQNASSLPYIPYEFDAPYMKEDTETGAPKVDAGVDMVSMSLDEPNTKTPVYFDKRFKTIADQNGKRKDYPKFIKASYDNKKNDVFILVHETDSYGYYQKIGKISDVYYTETPLNYHVPDYFDYKVASLPTVDDDGKKAITYSKLAGVIKKDAIIYISPSYNYDRSLRKKVQVTSVAKNTTGYGYTITYNDISPLKVEDTWDDAPKDVSKVLAYFGITMEEFATYTTEEQQILLECHG